MTAGRPGVSHTPGDDVRGLVGTIQPFSLHDGPGIRTTVFLKGCRWRCSWCANPETQAPRRELGFIRERCMRCGRCRTACAHGAVRQDAEGFPAFIRQLCGNCLIEAGVPPCLSACSVAGSTSGSALQVYGEWMRAGDVLDAVEAESVFYRHGGGGLTLSGGEVLDQPEFTLALVRGARERGIGTILETNGSSPDVLLQAAAFLDMLFCDIKHHDAAEHARITGGDLESVLSALRAVRAQYPALPIRVRTPIVPGYTIPQTCDPGSPGLEEAIRSLRSIAAFAASLGGSEYELLPWHPYGSGKYEALGREVPAPGPPGEMLMHMLREAVGSIVTVV